MVNVPDAALAGYKRCAGCAQTFPLVDFPVVRSRPDGRRSYCRSCKRERDAEYRRTHPQKRRQAARAYAERLRQEGRCVGCRGPLDRPGKTLCAACQGALTLRKSPHLAASAPCVLCGFAYSDVHHLDRDRRNNALANLVALCPNHHRLLHRGLLSVEERRTITERTP